MHWIFIQKQYRWTHAGDIAENEFVSGRYESNHKGPGCSMADDIYQADSYEHSGYSRFVCGDSIYRTNLHT